MSNGLQQVTNLSERQYSPQMTGGGSSLQISTSPAISKVEDFTNDIENLTKGLFGSAKAYFQLSDDAMKRVAIDHTVQYEEQKNAIMANNELSIQQKKEQLGGLVSSLNSQVSDGVMDNDRNKAIYDEVFNNRVRSDYSSQLARLDMQQNEIDLTTNVKNLESYLSSAGKYATLEDAKMLVSSNISQGKLYDVDVEKAWVESKATYANKVRMEDNTLFSQMFSNRDAYIQEFVPEFESLSEESKMKAMEGFEKVSDLTRRELTESSMLISNEILTQAIETDSLGSVESLINQTKASKDIMAPQVYLTTMNSLLSMKKGYIAEAHAKSREDSKYIKQIISDKVSNINNAINSTDPNTFVSMFEFNEDGSAILKKDIETMQVNGINTLYGDRPDKLQEELRDFYEDVEKKRLVAENLNKANIFEPNAIDVDDTSKSIINNKREQGIATYLSKNDFYTASRLIEANGKIPTSLDNTFTKGLNSRNPQEVIETVNKINKLGYANKSVRAMIYSDEGMNTQLILAQSILEKNNGNLTENDIKIIQGYGTDKSMAKDNWYKANQIVGKMNIDSTSNEFTVLKRQANMLYSYGLRDDEVKEALQIYKENTFYEHTSKTNVVSPPKWATPEVIGNVDNMFRDTIPELKKSKFEITSDELGNISLYTGDGSNKVLFANIDQKSYLAIVDSYRAERRNEKYNEYKYDKESQRLERNIREFERIGNTKKAKEYQSELDKLNKTISQKQENSNRKIENRFKQSSSVYLGD